MRPRRFPLASIAVAAVLLGGQAMAFLHLALVEHGRCAEHGEIIEGHGVAYGLGSHAPAAGLRVAPDDVATHEHEHCLFVVAQRSSARPDAGAADAAAAPTPAAPLPLRHDDAPATGRALFGIAPKTSPPA